MHHDVLTEKGMTSPTERRTEEKKIKNTELARKKFLKKSVESTSKNK